MDTTQFTHLLEQPALISKAETADLGKLIEQFPYFQSAHLLYLKGLHQNKSVEYPKQLKITAAYANDRKKLYELIMKEDLHEQIRLVEQETGKAAEIKTDISPLEAQILQEAVSASIKMEVAISTPKDIVEPQQPIETDLKIRGEKKHETTKGSTIIKKTNITTPEKPTFDRAQPRTFSDWLRSSEPSKSEPAETSKESDSEPSLIDKFIGSAPRIGDASAEKSDNNREPFFSPIDTARLSLIDDASFVTETLAGIYESQGYFEKAKNAYTLLSLNFPEKKDTFAARIAEIEKVLKKTD